MIDTTFYFTPLTRVQAESTSSSSETDESDSGGVTKRATVQSEEGNVFFS